jgi:DNA replication protein DnaC
MFDDEITIYERAETCDLLILDEFYVDVKARKCEPFIERLLRTRIDDKKATIITSNVSPAALKVRYPMLHSVLTEVTTFVDFDAKVNFR